MRESEGNGKIALGLGLIAVGILPTPDDVTILSPLAQIIGGTFLVGSGLYENHKRK